MITKNMNALDGLCNGTIGTLMKIVNDNEASSDKPAVLRLWLDFGDKEVGKKQRDIDRSLYDTDHIPEMNSDWTPIGYTCSTLFNSKSRYRIQRIQFQLIECEAMTIHKSQGQTYESIAVYLKSSTKTRLKRSLLYVALSRCVNIDGLYIYGVTSLLGKIKSEQELNDLAAMRSREDTNVEMRRMRRDAQEVELFPFMQPQYETSNCVTVMFHNVCNIGKYFSKLRSIENDIGFKHADVIFLVECHTVIENQRYCKYNDDYMFLPAKENLTHSSSINSSHGQICLVKRSLSDKVDFTFIARNEDRFSKNVNGEYSRVHKIELALYSLNYSRKNIYLLFAYMHPTSLQNYNAKIIKSFLDSNLPEPYNQYRHRLYVFGDFNFDCHKHQRGILPTMFRDLGLHSTLSEHTRTFRQKDTEAEKSISQIDWVYTNRQLNMQDTYVYPTWYSDHASLFTKIKLKK